jgi:hypothetical protein
MADSESGNTVASPIDQANLLVRLYELRREPVMREARSYVGGEFRPASADEFVAIVGKGGKHTGFILQVYGYWDMVAAFVRHNALDASLVYDTCQEMYFQYAKIAAFLPEFRRQMNLPEFLSSIEKVVQGSEQGRERLRMMRQNMDAIAAARNRVAQPAAPSQ